MLKRTTSCRKKGTIAMGESDQFSLSSSDEDHPISKKIKREVPDSSETPRPVPVK